MSAGLVDLTASLRYESFQGCVGPCTKDPSEEFLEGWTVHLASGPMTPGDTGTTILTGSPTPSDGGDTVWSSTAAANTCVGYGDHLITLSPPVPWPYDPEATFGSQPTFHFTVNETSSSGVSHRANAAELAPAVHVQRPGPVHDRHLPQRALHLRGLGGLPRRGGP